MRGLGGSGGRLEDWLEKIGGGGRCFGGGMRKRVGGGLRSILIGVSLKAVGMERDGHFVVKLYKRWGCDEVYDIWHLDGGRACMVKERERNVLFSCVSYKYHVPQTGTIRKSLSKSAVHSDLGAYLPA